jgi:hypothetical protein
MFLDNYVYLLSSWFSRFHTDSVEEYEQKQAVQIQVEDEREMSREIW